MSVEVILGIVIAVLVLTNIITLALVGHLRQQLKEHDDKIHIEWFDEVP